MPKLSPKRASVPVLEGPPPPHRGKVRDTYDLGNDHLLVYVTDAISIFDFVLNAMVPMKGTILMAMTHFWMMKLEKEGIPTHFVAAGAGIDEFLPEHLRGNIELQSRSMIVKRLAMSSGEFIFRTHYLSSSKSFKDYSIENGGEICGHILPPGLQDGDALPDIIDTPTTKAEEGHDLPLDAAATRAKYPEETELVGRAFRMVAGYAKTRGILMPDTKGEAGKDSHGVVTLGDEFGTPDSSRFWDLRVWQELQKGPKRKSPPPFDKQLVRQWGSDQGINKLNPENPDDVAKVHALEVPEALIEQTTQTYRYIFWRLTGDTIEDYLEKYLGVKLPRKSKRVDVVFGSRNDIAAVVGAFDPTDYALGLHVISCHRNPDELDLYAKHDAKQADVIVAAGGMAFALAGVLDAKIAAAGGKTRVIGVALGSNPLAPQLSISEVPGQPVIMDEMKGAVYTGKEGFGEALHRAFHGELPPPKIRMSKPAELNLDPALLK